MTNQVRIFVSSTFADFERERLLLHEQVCPTLREMSRHFGLELQLSDFRWGVTRADLAEDRTAALCLQEVDLCRRLSPEVNFLLLLGDRCGSRIVPATVGRDALEHLYADLRGSSDSAALEVLHALKEIFTQIVRGPPWRLSRGNEERDLALAASFAADTAAAHCMNALECSDPAAEELRCALAFSMTHREILRSGLLSPREGNAGAVSLIRSKGQVEPAQSDMRSRVAGALGERAVFLKAPNTDGRPEQADYEADFIRNCTQLLGELLHVARPRGTRRHYFSELRRTEPAPERVDSRHSDVLANVYRWVGGDTVAAALIGPRGSGRSGALEEAEACLRAANPDARVLRLSLGAQPDLENLGVFAATIIDALSRRTGDEDGPDTSGRRPDIIIRAEATLRTAERDGALFLLIDDLDRLDGGRGTSSARWLWANATSRRVLFTSCEDVALDSSVQTFALPPLSEAELRRCAEEAIRATDAANLDVAEVVDAVDVHRPGAMHEFVRIAAEVPRAERTGWRTLGPLERLESFLENLIYRAPFSKQICDLFLGLCLIREAGVSDSEFLAVCQDSPDVRNELEAHFPHCRFLDSVPQLVWHRLAAHFSLVVEARFRAGGQAWCVRDEFAAAVARSIGAAAGQALEALADLFRKSISAVNRRSAEVLPRLLSDLGQYSDLADLALTPDFMKQVVVTDRIDALLGAIGRSSSPGAIVAAITVGVADVKGLSPQARSHWLLDLSVLGRQLGFAEQVAALAVEAYEIRRDVLGPGDGLSVDACLEATDCLLEAQRSVEAEQLCNEVLAALGAAHHAAVTRLRVNRAMALLYLQRFAEAETIARAFLPELERDAVGTPELLGVYNALSHCCLQRGATEEAHDYAERAVDISSQLESRHSQRTAMLMLNLALIRLKRGLPAAAVDMLEEVLSTYAKVLDLDHPWVANAQHAYFAALSAAGRHGEATTFLNSQLERVRTFEPVATWMMVAAKTLATAVSQGGAEQVRTLYLRIDDLVTSSPDEAWTGELAGRYTRQLGAQLGLDDTAARGFLIAGIYVWILVLIAATRASIVREGEARKHLETLEMRIGQLMGEPIPLADVERIEQAWRLYTHEDWPAEARLLEDLLSTAQGTSLIDKFKALAQRAAPLTTLRARVEKAKAEGGADTDAAGQALILVAARAAAAGDYDAAIPAQAEAVAMAGRLFGTDSMQQKTAILNLGSLHFRAEQFSEAFDAYREGLEWLYRDAAVADRLGQAVHNAFRAGLEAKRFAEAGRLMALLASLSGVTGAAVNFNGMASMALLHADLARDAVVAFVDALAVFAGMRAVEAVQWAEPVTEMASMFADSLEGPEATMLARALRSTEERAGAAGWSQILSDRPDWTNLVSDLEVRATER